MNWVNLVYVDSLNLGAVVIFCRWSACGKRKVLLGDGLSCLHLLSQLDLTGDLGTWSRFLKVICCDGYWRQIGALGQRPLLSYYLLSRLSHEISRVILGDVCYAFSAFSEMAFQKQVIESCISVVSIRLNEFGDLVLIN